MNKLIRTYAILSGFLVIGLQAVRVPCRLVPADRGEGIFYIHRIGAGSERHRYAVDLRTNESCVISGRILERVYFNEYEPASVDLMVESDADGLIMLARGDMESTDRTLAEIRVSSSEQPQFVGDYLYDTIVLVDRSLPLPE